MSRFLRNALTPLVALAAIAVAGPTAADAQQQPPPVEPIENLDDAELETFAAAFIDITEIRQEVQTELASVQDPERAQEIQVGAQQEMQDVLEENDLDAERYRRIGVTINQDPELQARFTEIVAELRGGGGL